MKTRPLARADLITGLVLVIFGVAVVAESYGMPRLEERRINPWTAPGLVPGLLGVVIAVLGLSLAVRSLAVGALRPRAERSAVEAADARAARLRLGLCLALCLVYAVLLVGRAPFWLATGLFVFAFVVSFEWRPGDALRARMAKLAAAGLLAGGAALAVPYLFERLFLVRLP
jgi:putative tricarboxylic transport membrane protein